MAAYTLYNIIIVEVAFFVFKYVVETKGEVAKLIATIIIGLLLMSISFMGALVTLVTSADSNGQYTLWSILLIFFNMGYGYLRGARRVAKINKV